MLTFSDFARINRTRCESPMGFYHKLDSWSLSDWMTATMGELGEAANVAKKLNRARDGVQGNKRPQADLRDDLRREIGDVLVYLDLLSQSQGFALEDAVREVFNAKSSELGFPHQI